jgi:pimeloyl-ACP methyl ester carboxylesterase
MTNKLTHYLLALACCLFLSGSLQASDLEKEQRWREQTVDAILDGEPIDLNDGQHDFLAIYTEGDEDAKTGVIIMHGIGIHPDYPTVVNPLRVGLAERGWPTLSLQLPVLPNDAEGKDYAPLIPEATPRIKAGVDFLKQQGVDKVAIVAHSLGTWMASHAIDKGGVQAVAYVAIGMNEPAIDFIPAITIPMLDLYGGNDLPHVVDNAAKRKSAGAHNAQYSQVMTKGADHFFNGLETELVTTVDEWLQKYAR